MFGFFKKKKEKKPSLPVLADLDNQTLVPGDKVNCLRYGMGISQIEKDEAGNIVYVSEETGKRVSWTRMIDASTERQKVKKL